MTIQDRETSLLSEANKTLQVLDDIKPLARRLKPLARRLLNSDYDRDNNLDEIRSILRRLIGLCDEGSKYLVNCQQHAELLRAMLGVDIFLSAMSMGLPLFLSKKLSEVPADAWLIRNAITELKAVGIDITDFDAKKAQRQLSKVWTTIALGDQGELEVLKSLLDEGHSIEDIQVKPNLESKRPDFYVPGASLICDSKAYKKIHNINQLTTVINNYSKLLPNRGELRLYFPKDTYDKYVEKYLSNISNKNINGVKVCFFPMNKTHSELTFNLALLYKYLSFL